MRFNWFKGKAKPVEIEAGSLRDMSEAEAEEARHMAEVQPVVTFKKLKREDGADSITVSVKGKGQHLAVKGAHPNYDAIVAAAERGDPNVLDLFNIAMVAGVKFHKLTDRVSEAYGKLFIDGDEVQSALADQIVEFVREGKPFDSLVKFYERISLNPNDHAKEKLYGWLTSTGGFTITDDGLIVGYKSVRSTSAPGRFQSVHSGTAVVDGVVIKGQIPNYEGAVIEMQRDQVDFNPDAECSVGLHVGTFEYANTFSGDTMLEVHVSPSDVVSVPDGTESWKMRVRKYVVAGVIKEKYATPLIETKKAKPKGKKAKVVDLTDIRKGDVYADSDKRRKGVKRVVELRESTVVVESTNADNGKVTKREISRERLLSRRYNRVRRGRKQ